MGIHSSQDRANHGAGGIGEAVIAAVVREGQPGVVQAEQVEDGGVQVVHVHAVDCGAQADRVGRAVDGAPFDPAAGHPVAEAVRVVIAALAAFRHRHAAELAAPDHERALEQPARFRSLSSPAMGLSVRPHIVAWLVSTSSCASQPLTSPE